MKVLLCLLTLFVSALSGQIPGAIGDGFADDAPAFQAAINAACLNSSGAPDSFGAKMRGKRLTIPRTTQWYKLNSKLVIPANCSLDVVGEHLPTLYWPTSSAGIEVQFSCMGGIRNLVLQGNRITGPHAVHLTSTNAPFPSLACMIQLDRLHFIDWNSASVKLDRETNNGSIGLQLTNSQFHTYGPGVVIEAPTDLLRLEHNQFSSLSGRCVVFNGGGGSASVLLAHNNMTCAGGAVRIDGGAGIVTLRDNEIEQGLTQSPAPPVSISAAVVINQAIRVIVDNNTCNAHGNMDWCYLVGTQLYSGDAEKNTSSNARRAGWLMPSSLPRWNWQGSNIEFGPRPLVEYGNWTGHGSEEPGTPGVAMGYSYYRPITIDNTKVDGSSAHTDFPVLVSFTNNDLRTVANGGKVQNANGYDIGFFSDSALTTPLKWEMDRYVATTGQVVAWVKIPSLSHDTDTVIYIAYGDAGISTFQSTAADVWDSNFKGVWHLGDGTTLGLSDSTSNANTLTNGSASAATGKVSGAASFAATTYLQTPSNATVRMTKTDSITMEFWLNTTQTGLGYQVSNGGSGFYFLMAANGLVYCYLYDSSFATYMERRYDTAINNGAWRHVVWTYDGSVTAAGIKLYVDGDLVTLTTLTDNFSGDMGTTGSATIGYSDTGAQSMDEIRWQKGIARSAAWIKTSFNTQNDPATFFSLGAEVPILAWVNINSAVMRASLW